MGFQHKHECMDWTDEAIERLKQMDRDRLSFGEIGAAFGISRSAVAGKINRLRLSRRERPQTPKAPKRRTRKQKQQQPLVHVTRIVRSGRGNSLRLVSTPDCGTDDFPVCALAADDIPIAQRKQLLDLKHNDCRWPYGDPGKSEFFFCGAEQEPGYSYCAIHQRIARGASYVIPEAERARRAIAARKLSQQKWRIEPARGGSYRIRSRKGGVAAS